MRDGDVEPTRVVQNALDVLAQVIVAIVASDDDWTSAELFDLVRRAYPYHQLTRAAFDEVLAMLVGKYPSRRRRGARRAHHVGSRHRHADAGARARAWSP